MAKVLYPDAIDRDDERRKWRSIERSCADLKAARLARIGPLHGTCMRWEISRRTL